MNTFKLIIYQSLLIPLKIDGELIQQEFIRSQRALQNLPDLDLKIFDTVNSKKKIVPLKRLPIKIVNYWKLHKVYHRKEVYYKFIVIVKFHNKQFEGLEEEYNANELYISDILPREIEKRFYDLLMILNICRVGGFHFGIGIMKRGSGIFLLKKNSFYSQELFQYSIEKKWPNLKNLGIRKTWDWYLTKVNPKGIDEVSSTKLSRAFNAFSYLYENSEEINKLFWTMVGIEALYVKGKEGIAEQIKEKGQIFLGEIIEFKKRLSKMYEFRSAFIHGSKDFPSYFHVHDGIESYERFNDELFEILLTAESMLIATIQKMAEEDRTDLEFRYVLTKNIT